MHFTKVCWFLYLYRVTCCNLSARSITFLAKMTRSTLNHLVHTFLTWLVGLSRSIGWNSSESSFNLLFCLEWGNWGPDGEMDVAQFSTWISLNALSTIAHGLPSFSCGLCGLCVYFLSAFLRVRYWGREEEIVRPTSSGWAHLPQSADLVRE